ncbi:MAG: energy-coupled thiamine transporter ThiT [Angelakisella sp.]
MRNEKTRTLVECALMVALSAVLTYVKIAPWPNGGSITLASMAPIVFIALRHGPKWGLLTGFVFSLLQMLIDGISPPPTDSFFWFAMVILLDYVVAYTVLGLAPCFAKLMKNNKLAPAFGSVCVTLLRYLCHIFSGVLIWGVYAPEGMSPWVYSILYNGSYMIPETIITAIVAAFLVNTIKDKVSAKTTA